MGRTGRGSRPGLQPAGGGSRSSVHAVGSSTVYPFAKLVAESFARSNTDMRSPLIESTGTGNGIPATGRAVQITGTTLFRMADGRIAEEWTCADSLGLMKQLGLLATPAATPKAERSASAGAR